MAKAVSSKPTSKKSSSGSGQEQVVEFIKNTRHPLKKAVETLREIILSADKGITEHIKWNGPSFCFQDDDRITFNLHKNEYIMIVFHRGAKVKDSKVNGPLFKDETGLLEWLSGDRAVIKLSSLEDVNAKKDNLKKVVRKWITITSE